MNLYIIILLWALLSLAVLAVSKKYSNGVSHKFQNFGEVDIPYVTMNIQGNPMNMIVDTGCGVSMLNLPSLKGCELMCKLTNKAISLSALTSDKVEARAMNVEFNVGKKKISEDFFMQEHEDFGNFNRMYGINIHGLLGSSFFSKNNCNIDFKTHTLNVL